MDTSNINNPDDTPKSGFHVDGLDINEVLEVTEQLSELDHESKSMLFLICLSTFNELQNIFLINYKKLLHCKKTIKKRISEEELKLYNVLKESQNNFINKPIDEDLHEPVSPTPTSTPQQEISLLRSLWRRYRIELFVKIMLVIFLLKLPYFCYFITTFVYILYCFGFFSLLVRLSINLRNSRNAQSIVRVFINILESLEVLFMIPTNQDANAQRRGGQTTNVPGGRQYTGTDNRRTRTTTSSFGQAAPVQFVSEPNTTFVPPTPAPESSVPQSTTPFGPQLQNQQSQQTTSQQPEQVPETTNTREKPTYIEKFIYQVFFSFILSLLPWWEPNPVYLEE